LCPPRGGGGGGATASGDGGAAPLSHKSPRPPAPRPASLPCYSRWDAPGLTRSQTNQPFWGLLSSPPFPLPPSLFGSEERRARGRFVRHAAGPPLPRTRWRSNSRRRRRPAAGLVSDCPRSFGPPARGVEQGQQEREEREEEGSAPPLLSPSARARPQQHRDAPPPCRHQACGEVKCHIGRARPEPDDPAARDCSPSPPLPPTLLFLCARAPARQRARPCAAPPPP
jgi:hypothetical protein